MGLSQAQTVVTAGFIPGPAESGIVSRAEALRITEPKQTNGFYEAMLLAFSFVFLLLGLLPSQREQVSGVRVSGEEHGEPGA
jgi:hypothetical protein